MNVIRPYAKILSIDGNPACADSGTQALAKIEWCGRISHRSEEAQDNNSWRRFIQAVVLEKGDWSIVEHASATVDMVVDRGITHEWVRHRLFSFTQESTRFVNYEKKMPASFIDPGLVAMYASTIWTDAISAAEQAYKDLIAAGCAPQIARSVFSNSLASRIITTGNLRVWRHVFCMRTCKEAHPGMRQVIIPLLEEFKTKIPLLYDDIIPNSSQIANMRLPQ